MKRWFAILCLILPLSSAAVGFPFDTCSSKEQSAWREAVKAAVVGNWRVPYEDRYLACTVMLSLNWRGEVLNVGIANCGDDARVHRSVVNAGYMASPLRMPDNKSCYERNVILKLESRPLQVEQRDDSIDSE